MPFDTDIEIELPPRTDEEQHTTEEEELERGRSSAPGNGDNN
jgi:hypothetical protein